MAVAYRNRACAEVQKKDFTVPVRRSPGLGRTINLDSKRFNIQTKEKGPSWTCKRNRTSFSAEFRELWIETMGREAREDFLAGIGWDFRATPDGMRAVAVSRAPILLLHMALDAGPGALRAPQSLGFPYWEKAHQGRCWEMSWCSVSQSY